MSGQGAPACPPSADLRQIRFRFAANKALAALHWMVGQRQEVDLHCVLKTCYFADVAQLKQAGRPVFGASYKAMRFGPVPLEIYEMAKAEPVWLAELDLDRMPWALSGYRLRAVGNAEPDLNDLSRSDLAALRSAFAASTEMTFTERTTATHGSDWQVAQFGRMRYEDMIAEGPDKAELVAFLREAGPTLRL